MIEAVEITCPDGVVLRGELRRAGSHWAVLVHDEGMDLDAWRPLPAKLAVRGFSVLAIDLRGHGGSGGEADPDRTTDDLADVLAYARKAGAEHLTVGAAGKSAMPALEAAGAGCDALFLLGPVGEALRRSRALPTLVVAGSQDERQEATASELVRRASRTVVVRVPVAAPGCEFLASAWGRNVTSYITSFLTNVQVGAVTVR